MEARTDDVARLTPKGRATRARIIEAAADLIYRQGVHGTNNEALRRAAGVSGSQLSHYFPDKRSLVGAVLQWQADATFGLRDVPPRPPLDSVAALRRWARHYTARERWRGGCSFGSLVSEVAKSDLDLGDEIRAGFDQLEARFREGLQAMQERGQLVDDADPARLAHLLMAAFQGGMLIAQSTGRPVVLADAMAGAIDHIAAFAVDD